MNLKIILDTLRDVREYVIPIKKITSKFSSINSIKKLENFIQERSAHVTQTTLYGYVKTRIGSRHTIMFEDKVFSESLNIAKWNIYMAALSDCTLYTYSYLIDKKNLKTNDAEETFISIIGKEKNNGLSLKLHEETIINFKNRIKNINWHSYHSENPFEKSSIALYKWSPIADELKKLDKEIVINSIKLKWNVVENEFKELTKKLSFN